MRWRSRDRAQIRPPAPAVAGPLLWACERCDRKVRDEHLAIAHAELNPGHRLLLRPGGDVALPAVMSMLADPSDRFAVLETL